MKKSINPGVKVGEIMLGETVVAEVYSNGTVNVPNMVVGEENFSIIEMVKWLIGHPIWPFNPAVTAVHNMLNDPAIKPYHIKAYTDNMYGIEPDVK